MSEEKKITSPLKAIRAYCVECSGGPVLASRCDNEVCKLFAFRTGHNPYAPKRTISEEQKQKAKEALKKWRESRQKTQ